jgi:uncharacterized membrane protein YqgA involved in biofilm formation
MTGTIINVVAILLGSALGTFLGGKIPEKLKQTVVSGMGLFTFALGIQMFLKTGNALIVLGSLVIGALLGEWWKIEDLLSQLGGWLEQRFNHAGNGEQTAHQRERFIRGFLTASLVFVVGPVAILGAIQDGISGDYRLLAVKSVLDGFASLAFSSSLGIGVAFSALPILVYQGAISLLASQVQAITTSTMMNEMTATGGILLMGIAVSGLLEIKKIRTGNFLPALIIAPLIVALLTLLGVQVSLP